MVTLGEGGTKIWVSFKCERLLNLCYWCGQLEHSDKDCLLWIQSKGMLTTEHRQFGQNLRAPPYRLYNKPIVFVPGYYENVARPIANRENGEGDNLEVETKNATCSTPMRSIQIWKWVPMRRSLIPM